MNEPQQTIPSSNTEKTPALASQAAVSIAATLGVLLIFTAGVWSNRSQVASFLLGGGSSARAENAPTSGIANLYGQEQLIVDIVAEANPAVVSVIVTKDVPVVERYFQEFNPFNDPNGGIQVPRLRQNGTQPQEVGGGSGFFVSSDGLIVTNKHVVDDPQATYTIFTNEGKKYAVDVIARDPTVDIAILKIKGSAPAGGFPSLTFDNSSTLKLGQTAIAIGNALGQFRNSVSVGVISGLLRSITAGDAVTGESETLDNVIQTDAAINPGNSGGPLLDSHGQVIGVNVAVVQGSENIGFAIPTNVVQDIVNSVKTYGQIVRPYLGVRYVAIDKEVAQADNLSVEYGALVQKGSGSGDAAVLPGSPAAQAGIVEGDIILSIDGVSLKDRSLASIIRDRKVGQTVTVVVLHNAKQKTIAVTLQQAPQE